MLPLLLFTNGDRELSHVRKYNRSKIVTCILAEPSFFQPKLRHKFLGLYMKIYGKLNVFYK